MTDAKTRLIIEVYTHCSFYMGQPLQYHSKLVKCTGPFLVFQTKQIKLILLYIRSNSFEFKLLSNFSFYNLWPLQSVMIRLLLNLLLGFNDRC